MDIIPTLRKAQAMIDHGTEFDIQSAIEYFEDENEDIANLLAVVKDSQCLSDDDPSDRLAVVTIWIADTIKEYGTSIEQQIEEFKANGGKVDYKEYGESGASPKVKKKKPNGFAENKLDLRNG